MSFSSVSLPVLTRIILVDDDTLITDALPLLLKIFLPVQVVAVNSSLQALEEIQRHPPHLLLTDYKMPDLGGIELAERARVATPGLPIILLTGYEDDPECQAAASRLEGLRILPKPWNTERLLKTICDLCSMDKVQAPVAVSAHSPS